MAGQSQVDIINLALGHISQRPITSLSENSAQANAALRVYDSCLRECLRGHDWGFATVIQPLALVSNYTPFGWSYAYAYPASCLGFWHLYNDQTLDKTQGETFRELYVPALNQKVIVTNCANAYGEYTYYLTDTTLFDANFVTVLSYRLAADLAMPLNADDAQAKSMIAIFNSMMNDAERMSSYENNQEEGQKSSSFEDSRG